MKPPHWLFAMLVFSSFIVIIISKAAGQACPKCWHPLLCEIINDPNIWNRMQCDPKPLPLPEPNQPELTPVQLTELRWISYYWLNTEVQMQITSEAKSMTHRIGIVPNGPDLAITTRGFDDPNIVITKERITYKTFTQKFYREGTKK